MNEMNPPQPDTPGAPMDGLAALATGAHMPDEAAGMPQQRRSPRKLLRTRVRFGTKGGAVHEARTLDVSMGGLCMSSSMHLKAGEDFFLTFDALVNGATGTVMALAEVVYCTYSGDDAFKVGLKFLHLSKNSLITLKTLLDS